MCAGTQIDDDGDIIEHRRPVIGCDERQLYQVQPLLEVDLRVSVLLTHRTVLPLVALAHLVACLRAVGTITIATFITTTIVSTDAAAAVAVAFCFSRNQCRCRRGSGLL